MHKLTRPADRRPNVMFCRLSGYAGYAAWARAMPPDGRGLCRHTSGGLCRLAGAVRGTPADRDHPVEQTLGQRDVPADLEAASVALG